jgi:hypothetical protein
MVKTEVKPLLSVTVTAISKDPTDNPDGMVKVDPEIVQVLAFPTVANV